MSDFISHFSWLDLIYILILLGTIYKGSKRGVSTQLISLVGYVLLVYLALGYYLFVSKALFGFLLQNWARPVSFSLITIIVLFILKLIDRALNVVDHDDLATIERIGGMLVAGIRGSILIGVLCFGLALVPIESVHKVAIRDSALSKYFISVDFIFYTWIIDVLGSDVPDVSEQKDNFFQT